MQTKEMFVFGKTTVQLNSTAFYSGKKPKTEQMKIRKRANKKINIVFLPKKEKNYAL